MVMKKRVFTATYRDKKKMAKYLSSLQSEYKRLTNVWVDIREPNISWNKKEANVNHLTPKPLKAIERIIKVHTFENNLVLDPFLGSGTTAVAAEMLNRRWIGVEINLEYCEVARKRLSKIQPKLPLDK